MRIHRNYLTSLLAVGAAAVAIVGAPIAVAAPTSGQSAAGAAGSSAPSDPAPTQQCNTLGGTESQCQSPGNAQVYDAPPQVDYFPYAGGGT